MIKKELQNDPFRYLPGGGESGELIRMHDWVQTPVGDPASWPPNLRITLGIILHSAFPMFLFWGKEHICFYNDAYRPSLGFEGKHPAIGRKGKEVWPEIWDFIGPLIENVTSTATSMWYEDQYLPIYRNGKIDEVYWTFSYSPVLNENGIVDGVLVTCNETTGKVNAIKQLLDSEKRVQNLIRKVPVGIVVLTGEENIISTVNDAFSNIVERDESSLLGKQYFNIVPENEHYFKKIISSVKENGETFRSSVQPYFVNVDGNIKELYLNLVIHPYHEDDKTIHGVILFFHDITQHFITLKRSEKSESLVRSIIENAPFPIAVYMGREMRIELVNQSIIETWGKGSDVVGKLYADVLPELYDQGIYEKLDEVYTTGVPFHAKETRVDLVVDGKLKPFYFNFSFLPLRDIDGNIYGVMNTAADITDLMIAKQKIERSEKDFRLMILKAPVAMCMLLGIEHVVEVANDLMFEIWGKEKSAMINKPLFTGLPDAKNQGLEEILQNVYHNGTTFTANERPVKLVRNGKVENLYVNFVYEPFRSIEGTSQGILVAAIDVTEQVIARHKIEDVVSHRTKELATANSHLQMTNAELAQFAYIASHDLQEPVRKVSIYAQMLESNLENGDEKSLTYVNKIKHSTSRMLTLIRDVLAYSELSKGDKHFSTVDLQNVIDEVLLDFELLIQQKNAKIETRNLCTVDAIELHMSQLFGNLISNALKFSKPDVDPIILIYAEYETEISIDEFPTLEPGKKYCKIVVEDNGIGFNQAYGEQIFNIFQRLHGKKDYDGTGIGLAMCQKIVQNHGGEIVATAEPGVGSKFTIMLPVKK